MNYRIWTNAAKTALHIKDENSGRIRIEQLRSCSFELDNGVLQVFLNGQNTLLLSSGYAGIGAQEGELPIASSEEAMLAYLGEIL